jgi:hypothetical protein
VKHLAILPTHRFLKFLQPLARLLLGIGIRVVQQDTHRLAYFIRRKIHFQAEKSPKGSSFSLPMQDALSGCHSGECSDGKEGNHSTSPHI